MTDLRTITDFSDLLAYLADELDWPVADYGLDDLTFEYDADELGLKDEEAEKLKDGTIRQLRPLPGGQPFGIFFVEFGQAKLPVVVLRRILNALVIKKRNSANPADRQRWDAADLLFISAFGESDDREIAFAHFHKDPDTTELPILRVLGWDGADTPLKLAHVAGVLKNRLTWPDDPGDHDAWREQWRGAFRHRLGHVIKTAAELADALAGFARKIRDAATTVMAHESEAKGQLRKLHGAFQSALISDLTEEDFADTYAQTVTYGLLTAAISRTEMTEGARGTALTQEDITAMVPVTNPFLKEMLQEFLKVGGRSGGVDFDELGINEVVELLRGDETDLPAILRDFGNRKPGEDPVIHFYENFLAAYNKKLRIQRGVFYTPQPVVSYIVRSVHELLQTEFGLKDGLADTTTWGEMIRKRGAHAPSRVVSGAPAGNISPHTETSAPTPNQAGSPAESSSARARTTAREGACAPPISKVGWTPDDGGTVWLDGKGAKGKYQRGTSGFRPVPEEVWNFHIGGYQVCEKWLKDRGPKKGQPGRTLTDEDIAHYHKIVIALTETIRIMSEIDEVIETHGGWPGAFQPAAEKAKS